MFADETKKQEACSGSCGDCGECVKSIDELTVDELKYLYRKEKSLNEGLIAENEALIQEQEKTKAEKPQESDEYLRQLAAMKNDFENYKRRTKKASEEALDEGRCSVVELLLPLLDSFLRAERSEKNEQTKQALQLLQRQLEKTLREAGVEEIEVLGTEFDPSLANAVMKTEVKEDLRNKVVEVVAKGYKYKSKIIRHAQVIVGA